MVGLYNRIKFWKNKNFTYKFLINPETIGSLCFLKSHEKDLKKNLISGLVLTCLGGKKKYLSYKLSKNENSNLDRLLKLFNEKKIKLREYDPSEGSDERQYNSPGFDLPVGNIIRDGYMDYVGYHNSGDNKKYMNIKKIEDSINIIESIYKNLDLTLPIKRHMPYGELMLGKRNLYPNMNSDNTRDKSNDNSVENREELNILLTILGYSDGKKNILDIIELKKLNPSKSFNVLKKSLKLKLLYFLN
jgi:aminopeptidase-like protein